MKILILNFLVTFFVFNSNIQQDDYITWNKKMKNSFYLKEMLKVGEESKARIENNYYGNDLQLIKKVDKNCYKTETDLTNCLKAVGFKKAADFSKSIYLTGFYWSKFLDQNPGFYKLERETRIKLLKQFYVENPSKRFLM
jgi:hypothetical protein